MRCEVSYHTLARKVHGALQAVAPTRMWNILKTRMLPGGASILVTSEKGTALSYPQKAKALYAKKTKVECNDCYHACSFIFSVVLYHDAGING